MDKEIEVFKTNVDSWIKQFKSDLSGLSELPSSFEENNDNIQHNYELIREMRNEIEGLKKEINLLKISHIIMLKEKGLP
jgi:hypothetical protein